MNFLPYISRSCPMRMILQIHDSECVSAFYDIEK